MKRTWKILVRGLAVGVAALLLQSLILYFCVLNTSAIDIPTAMNVKRVLQAGTDLHALTDLETARTTSTDIIGALFTEMRTMELRGSKWAHLFERYPVFLITLEYGEGAENTLMYIEVAADRRITVSKGGTWSYCGYVSERSYDLLIRSYDAAVR